MKEEWAKMTFDQEADGGAGAGGSIGEMGGDAGAPEPPSNATDVGGEAPPPPDSGGAPAADPPAAAEPGPVPFNSKLHQVFVPGAPAPTMAPGGATPPPVQPGTPAPQPPTSEEWTMTPDVAAQKQQAYMEYRINQGVEAAKKPVEEMRAAQNADKQASFNAAASKAKEAVEHHWENVLNRDKDFRGDPKVQELTSNYMGEFIANALNYGSVEDLQFITTTRFARRALAMAMADLDDIKSFQVHPTGGPTVVGPQGQKQPGPVTSPEDQEAADEASKFLGRKVTPQELANTRKELDDMDF